MTLWEINMDPEVREILDNMTEKQGDKAAQVIGMLEEHGPNLERFTMGALAHALKNSRHANLKELIVKSGKSVWRFAYYIDKTMWCIYYVVARSVAYLNRCFIGD